MFEIINNKVVKKETIETLIEVSSKSIEAEIKWIDSVIKSLNENKSLLTKQLTTVKSLESQLK